MIELLSVKQAVDIPALLQRIFDIEVNGQVVFCPFHQNTVTPAFHVRAEGKKFFCYGCGKRGDVIDFVRAAYEVKGGGALDFKTALRITARLAGVEIEDTPEGLDFAAQVLREAPRPIPVAPGRLREWSHWQLSSLILEVRNAGSSGSVGLAQWLGTELDDLWYHARPRVAEYQRRVQGLVKVARKHLDSAWLVRTWVTPDLFLPLPA